VLFVMSRTRSHLSTVVLATLGVQALVLALGTARVCWVPEHTHRGRPAPDCQMHHQAPPALQGHHHGAGAAQAPPDVTRVACSCSSVVGMFGGAVAILVPEMPPADLSANLLLSPAGHHIGGRLRVPPLLPPPRLPSL
jgi:hypothetical protein